MGAMGILWVAGLSVVCAGAAACGSKEEETGDPKPAAEVATPGPVTPPHPPGQPDAQSDAQPAAKPGPLGQCEAIYAKSWEAAKAGVVALGQDVDAVKAGYFAAFRRDSFLEKCKALPAEVLGCIEAADQPMADIVPCGQKAKIGASALPPRAFIQFPRSRPAAFDSAQVSALLTHLQGKWMAAPSWGPVSQWMGTWTISANGKVTQIDKGTGTRSEKMIKPILPPTAADSWASEVRAGPDYPIVGGLWFGEEPFAAAETFFQPRADLFFLQAQVAKMRDGRLFASSSIDRFVVGTVDACQVVDEYGSVLPATCTYGQTDGDKTLTVEYRAPSWAHSEVRRYYVFGDYLVEPNRRIVR